MQTENIVIRKAVVADVPQVHALIHKFAAQERMLPRSFHELYEHLRDFWVAEWEGKIVGCCALHLFGADLAEIKSLAVAESHQNIGIGRRLVQACVAEALQIGIPRLFCLTYEVEFFQRCGFRVVDRAQFPRKVWTECVRCPKFFHCTEVAMVREVATADTSVPAEKAVAAQ